MEPLDCSPAALARYLSGEADRDERIRVERWIAAHPRHEALADMLRTAWDRPAPPEFDPDDAVWQRIRDRITAPPQRPISSPIRRVPRPQWLFRIGGRSRSWLSAAAVVIAVAAGVLVMQRTLPESGAWFEASRPGREIATRRGERLALRLADGTRVVLAPESRLRLAGRFSASGQGSREVWLEGEALFEVVHDSTRPFRVYTSSTVAEDLGTEFVVMSRPQANGTWVVVVSGVVALRRPDQGEAGPVALTLQRGDLGAMDAGQVTAFQRDVDVQPYVSWAEGTLMFDGTALRDVVPVLRRWYDVDIRLGEPALAEKKLTATFRDESISQVLKFIAMALDLTVEQHGDVTRLYAKSDHSSVR